MYKKEKIAQIYTLYSREIFLYLCRFTGNNETSEDLLHEVFEKFIIYTSEKTIDEKNIRAFLYKTGHNLCVNYLIKTSRIKHDNIEEFQDSLRTEDRTLENLVLSDLNSKVYRILESMNPESRSIFIMNKENGMTYDEIARMLSLSARTVRRRIREVLNQLYEELKKDGFIS